MEIEIDTEIGIEERVVVVRTAVDQARAGCLEFVVVAAAEAVEASAAVVAVLFAVWPAPTEFHCEPSRRDARFAATSDYASGWHFVPPARSHALPTQ